MLCGCDGNVIRRSSQYVIMPHTYLVRDFAPKLATRFGKGVISDCIRAAASDGAVTFSRRIFLGKVDADVVTDGGSPIFATFQSGAYRADQAAKGASAAGVERMPVEVGEVRMQPEPAFQEVTAVDRRSGVIVAVGRGIKAGESGSAEKLAAALGGNSPRRALSAMRVAPIDRRRLIRTDRRPSSNVALGISGATNTSSG